MPTCAIRDDHRGVATTFADRSPLRDTVVPRPFRAPFETQDALAAAIADCEIVAIMHERTPFDASLFARLPSLRLLVTSGLRNAAIDLAAAKAHGVTVCGTASRSEPPVELTWAPTSPAAASGSWGLGKVGTRVARVGQAFGTAVSAWSEPHGGAGHGGRRGAGGLEGGADGLGATWSRSPSC